MHDKLPPGITLIKADDFKTWLMDIRVIDTNPIYDGEIYRLKFAFSPQYPIEVRLHILRYWHCMRDRQPLFASLILTLRPPQPPEVTFVRDEAHPIPFHPHIYSNGIICLDLLDRAGWSPVHNVESVCVSLQSMLSSNTKKERPEGDDNFVRYNTQRPRDINFVFHDDNV